MSSKNVDRLSILPVEILSHIFSLIPMKFVVRTSILSKRWRYSWMLVTNFNFEDIHKIHDRDSFVKFLDLVLKCFKTSQAKLFRLHFSGYVVGRLSAIKDWIDKAVRLSVCELDINVFLFEFPTSLFTCKTLTKLRIVQGYYHFPECQCLVSLPCLKILDMVVSGSPFISACKIISGCPILESLSLEIRHSGDKEDYIFSIPTLKRLKLTLVSHSGVKKVVLNVPKLEYLFVDGTLGSLSIMDDMSSLVEASVSFYKITSDHLWVELLRRISGVTSLSLTKIPSTFLLPVFPNMKRLELMSFRHYGQALQFLESCPALKHLYIEKNPGYSPCREWTRNPRDSHWIEPKLVPSCLQTNLTTIKFPNNDWVDCDIDFLEYMLRNGGVLKTVTINWDHYTLEEEEAWLCAELLRLMRASRRRWEIDFCPAQRTRYRYGDGRGFICLN